MSILSFIKKRLHMAEFSQLNGKDQSSDGSSIVTNGQSVTDNALGLTNPDSVLSGTLRGQQSVGSGSTGTTLIDSANNRIIIRDSANSRVLIGKLPDGTYGVAVSKTGFDVTSAFS